MLLRILQVALNMAAFEFAADTSTSSFRKLYPSGMLLHADATAVLLTAYRACETLSYRLLIQELDIFAFSRAAFRGSGIPACQRSKMYLYHSQHRG